MIGRKRQVEELPDRLGHLSEALELAKGRVEPDAIDYAEHVLDKASQRLKHGTTHTVVALLGATGAGKSSITNQLVGSDVATTGVRRPTTSSTMASTWGADDPHALLDWLGVASRHSVGDPAAKLEGLILLDVPDHDSVTEAHREEMERIAEHADLLVWVTDPEKYADASMHSYLKQLASHKAVTVMVLNKADRLSETELDLCRSDLARLLVSDGLPSSQMVATSATTGHGIAELKQLLVKAVADKAAVTQRLEADLSVAVTRLRTSVREGKDLKVSSADEKRLAKNLVASTGIDVVSDAVASAHKRDAAAAVGWPVTRWAGKLRRHPLNKLHLGENSSGRSSVNALGGANEKRCLAAIREFADSTSSGLEEPWPTNIRSAATPSTKTLRDEVDSAIATAVRDRKVQKPGWWAVVRLVQNLLAAIMVFGLLWLGGIFLVAWFQLPPLPTPDYRGFPIPTIAAIGGALVGILLAVGSKQLARIGAKRRRRHVSNAAAAEVSQVAEGLVIAPVRAEVDRYNKLNELLSRAAGN